MTTDLLLLLLLLLLEEGAKRDEVEGALMIFFLVTGFVFFLIGFDVGAHSSSSLSSFRIC